MKNALLAVVAFALGAGAVWYFTSNRSGVGPAANVPGARGPAAKTFHPVKANRPHKFCQ